MSRPNFLIFMTDQQRADTTWASELCHTPNLDRLRDGAVEFRNAYCPSPHCCPSRATFMSGLYPSEHGVWHNVQVANAISRSLRDGVRLWSEDFAAAGYEMVFSGKWHVSATTRPSDHGWAERLAFAVGPDAGRQHIIDSRWATHRRAAEHARVHPDQPAPEGYIHREGYGRYVHYGQAEKVGRDEDIVSTAVEIIRARSADAGPWCQFVGNNGPHDSYHVPKRFLDMYPIEGIELPRNFEDAMGDKPGFYRRTRDIFGRLSPEEHRQAIRHYLALCTYEDWLFGQVLDALAESGQMANTVVMYLSDHGDYMGEHGLWTKGVPCFRGAYNVPALIHWPAGIANPGRTVDAMVSLADFAPTLLELAGVDVERPFTGQSLTPFLRDETPLGWRDAIFFQTNGNELYGIQRAVQTDRWKFVYNGFDYDELYDLHADPGEVNNLIANGQLGQHAGTVKALSRRLWQFAYDHADEPINPYITVSFPSFGPGVIFEE